jgi:D-alanine-D-alanine ligase
VKRPIRLGILFGGRSEEHEVSVYSARSMCESVDPERFVVVPIGITRDGAWRLGVDPRQLPRPEVNDESGSTGVLADISYSGLVPALAARGLDGQSSEPVVDVVFPLLHGPYGEDGTVQGMLELARVPYVGSGVLASAVGMDKEFMKRLFNQAGLPSPKYVAFTRRDFELSRQELIDRLVHELGLPIFVKPCRLGSSVGIEKAHTTNELWASISHALEHDDKVIAEETILGREIECGLLGNEDPAVSVFGEIVPKHEFYDYEAKYTDGLADLTIPARLSPEQVHELRDYAVRAFKAIDATGMARVDFFVQDGDPGRIVVNEINTIPGFSPTSMFPKLWEAGGISYGALIERLVELALERHPTRRRDWRP